MKNVHVQSFKYAVYGSRNQWNNQKYFKTWVDRLEQIIFPFYWGEWGGKGESQN